MPYAPLCDDRGASAIAPPPTFEATDEAVRRTVAASCGDGEQSLFASIAQGRAPTSPEAHATDPALPARMAWSVRWAAEIVDPVPEIRTHLRGVRAQVERPPD